MFVTLGGVERRLNRLTRRQFCELMERMPVLDEADRMFLTVFDVHRWAASPTGAVAVLAMAMDVSEQEARNMGTLVEQSAIASLVTAESLSIGELLDEDEDHSGDEQRPDPTGT